MKLVRSLLAFGLPGALAAWVMREMLRSGNAPQPLLAQAVVFVCIFGAVFFGFFLSRIQAGAFLRRRGYRQAASLISELYFQPLVRPLKRALDTGTDSELRATLDLLTVEEITDDLEALNLWVCSNISVGRYNAARAAASFAPEDHGHGWALILVNVAEADFNVESGERALQRLNEVTTRLTPIWPMLEAGHAQQQAWAHALLGSVSTAREIQAEVSVEAFPHEYVAEFHFTNGFIELLSGNAAAAMDHFHEGAAVAIRLSSKRNALFLLARANHALGQSAEAFRLFEEAANHPFKGQGGDGLLCWGDALRDAGRLEEARNAWRLVLERDSESVSAKLASERLAKHAE